MAWSWSTARRTRVRTLLADAYTKLTLKRETTLTYFALSRYESWSFDTKMAFSRKLNSTESRLAQALPQRSPLRTRRRNELLESSALSLQALLLRRLLRKNRSRRDVRANRFRCKMLHHR